MDTLVDQDIFSYTEHALCVSSRILEVVSQPLQVANFCAVMDTLVDQDVCA